MLLLLPIVSADLLISPSGYDGTVYRNIEKKAELGLKNTYDFPIYDIQFTPIDYVSFPEISIINPNESIRFNFTVKATETFSKKTFNSVVKFWYYSEINLDSKIYDINITNDAFIPDDLTIKIGDSIRFNNNADAYSSIKDDYSPYKYFDKIIQVNQSVTTSPLSQIDSFYYTDWNLWKKGHITVQNISYDKINNPDYNKAFTISFDSRHVESELAMELYPYNNITMNYNEFQEISVRIWNNGQNTIYNVSLSASEESAWFYFEDNNFDLTTSQNRYIDLRITPNINETEQTNMTYSIDIHASSENAADISSNLKIFIPFADDIYRIYYSADFWESKARFCDNYPSALECNPPAKVEKVIEKIYLNSTIEYTKEEAMKNDREQNQRLSNLESDQEKIGKSTNENTVLLNQLITSVNNLSLEISKANEIADNSQKDNSELTISVLLFIFLIIIISGGTYVIYYARRKKQAEINKAA